MADTQIPCGTPKQEQKKKACQIQIMFPVVDDREAFAIKQAIDSIVGTIDDKRYTFNISEM